MRRLTIYQLTLYEILEGLHLQFSYVLYLNADGAINRIYS
jgi:hypothetical protein